MNNNATLLSMLELINVWPAIGTLLLQLLCDIIDFNKKLFHYLKFDVILIQS